MRLPSTLTLEVPLSKTATRTPIPARSGWSAQLPAGSTFSVIDVEGSQAADLWVYNPEDPTEFLSAHHTRVSMGRVYPEVGWTFTTNRRRPLLEFVADTSPGRHDCLAAACDRARYELLGAGTNHASCEQNLQVQAERHGFTVSAAPQPINVFANFRVYPDGSFKLEEGVSKAGDAASFRLLADGIVVLSACPQDIVPFQVGGPSDMAVEVSPAP
jgi:uncharacterized protein YcgI (DUF1989 family)